VLIRVILWYLKDRQADTKNINITFYKNMVTNDKEVTEILSKSTGIISDKTRTKNHPYVEDLDEELTQLKAESAEADTDYPDDFGSGITGGDDDG